MATPWADPVSTGTQGFFSGINANLNIKEHGLRQKQFEQQTAQQDFDNSLKELTTAALLSQGISNPDARADFMLKTALTLEPKYPSAAATLRAIGQSQKESALKLADYLIQSTKKTTGKELKDFRDLQYETFMPENVVSGLKTRQENLYDTEAMEGLASSKPWEKTIQESYPYMSKEGQEALKALKPEKDIDTAAQTQSQWKQLSNDKYQLGIINRGNKKWEPVIDDNGLPIMMTYQQMLESGGKKTESVSDPFGNAYKKETGKQSGEFEGTIAKQEQGSISRINTLTTMEQLLDSFESGKTANWKMKAQQWGQALGVPVDVTTMSAKEAFNAMAEQLALQSRNQGEGMTLAGQMSDRDVQFLRDMNPQLIISKAGNKMIIKIRKAIAKRDVEVAKLAREYKRAHGGVLDQLEFGDYVKEKLGNTSVFGIPESAALVGTDSVTGLPAYKSVDGKHYIPNF